MDALVAPSTFWQWFILCTVFMVFEVLLPGFVFMWMAVAAGVTGFLVIFLPSLSWQVQAIVFAVLSVGSVALGRMYRRRHSAATDRPTPSRSGEHGGMRGSLMLTSEERSDAAVMGSWGMLSGTAVWIFLNLADSIGLRSLDYSVLEVRLSIGPVSVIPGLVFGIVFAVLLRRRGKAQALGQLGYVFAAGVAYFLAYHVAFNTFDRWPFGPEATRLAMSGILSGVAGSLLLGLMTTPLLRVPARALLLLPVAVGGVAGALLALVHYDHSESVWSLLVLFVVWQGGYAASLAPALRLAPAGPRAGK